MYLTPLLPLSLFPLLAAAQYGYGDSGGGGGDKTTSAAASAPSAPADTDTQKNINVGFNGAFVFNPANITAKKGTLVTFWFPNFQAGHSVSQSSFDNPCTSLAANGSTPAGFDSGLTSAKQFTINITDDTKPIWFHCKQVGHCGMGMVGSINAPATGNTFEAFQNKAKSLGSNAPTEKDNGPVTGGVNGIATAAPSAASKAPNNGAMKIMGGSSVALVSAAVLALIL